MRNACPKFEQVAKEIWTIVGHAIKIDGKNNSVFKRLNCCLLKCYYENTFLINSTSFANEALSNCEHNRSK